MSHGEAFEKDLLVLPFNCELCQCDSSNTQYLKHRHRIVSHYLSQEHQLEIVQAIQDYLQSIYSRRKLEENKSTVLFNINQWIEILERILAIVLDRSRDIDRFEHIHSIQTQELNSHVNLLVEVNKSEKILVQNLEILHEKMQHLNKRLFKLEDCRCKMCIPTLDQHGSILFIISQFDNDSKFNQSWSYLKKFRTSPSGYCFELELKMKQYDDGTYLTVDFHLTVGDYDNLLIFPFKYNIYCTICHQSNMEKDIVLCTEALIHRSISTNSTTFQKQAKTSIRLCRLDTLFDSKESYYIDGQFFLRVFIDFLNQGYKTR